MAPLDPPLEIAVITRRGGRGGRGGGREKALVGGMEEKSSIMEVKKVAEGRTNGAKEKWGIKKGEVSNIKFHFLI